MTSATEGDEDEALRRQHSTVCGMHVTHEFLRFMFPFSSPDLLCILSLLNCLCLLHFSYLLIEVCGGERERKTREERREARGTG
jgi:hypothetical protein